MTTKIVPSRQKQALLRHLVSKHAGSVADRADILRIGDGLTDDLKEVRVRKELLQELTSSSSSIGGSNPPTAPVAASDAVSPLQLVAKLRDEGPQSLNASLSAIETFEELLAIAQFNSVAVSQPLRESFSKEELVARLLEATEKRVAGIKAGAGQRLRRG